jgi:hypothetical protein
MFNQIRKLLARDDSPRAATNPVELDETYIGGRSTRLGERPKSGRPSAKSHNTPDAKHER